MGQELTIGRGYSNLLRLEGEEVSRVHAIIYRRNEDFILRDLDSKNGVFLNGSKVNHAPLGPGDRVQVGKYKMVFNPPSNFDLQAFASNSAHTDPASAGKGLSAGADKPDYESSRRFKVAPGGHPACDSQVERDACEPREEVYFFTPAEFKRRLTEEAGRLGEMAADYQDLFFGAVAEVSGTTAQFDEAILEALCKTLSADRGVIVLRDADGELRPGAIVAEVPDVAVNRIILKSSLAESKAVLCPRTDESGLFRDNDTVKRDHIGTLLAVPLGGDYDTGVLYLDRTGETEPFNLAHLITAGRVARLLDLFYRGR